MSSPYDLPGERVAILSDDSVQMQETVETSYRALNGLAVASVVFGALSAVTFIDWTLAIVPVIGIALGWIALKRVRRNPEESIGVNWARSGIALSAALWVGGYGWLTYGYFHQTPPGYELITFKSLQPDPNRPDQRVSEESEMLDKRKVFVWGYMFPGRQRSGIKEFLLVDDPGSCAYCSPKPRPTQLIRVKLMNNLKTEFSTRLIGVGGEFTVHSDPREEGMGGLVYQIEGDCLR
jgi:hypothetical protein